jgi:hypothetical protein
MVGTQVLADGAQSVALGGKPDQRPEMLLSAELTILDNVETKCRDNAETQQNNYAPSSYLYVEKPQLGK